MKRGHANAPSRQDLHDGDFDREWLLGSYKRLFLGHATPAQRARGASGGVLTSILAGLLERDELDVVLAVGFAEGDPVQPRYLVLDSPDAVRCQAGSCYTYIPAADLLQIARKVEGKRIGIICQPCHVPLVRRWQSKGRYDVRFVASFFCGWNMHFAATRYLLKKAEVREEDVESLGYRRGGYPGGFGVRAKNGREVLFGKECYELVNMQFLRRGCSRCSLYMGEDADLVGGDAWLREHQGYTALIARTDAGLAALEPLRSTGEVQLYDLPELTLLHMHLHNLIYKKYGLSRPMLLLTWLFNRALPKALAPFRLLTALSRQRRKYKVGVSLPELQPVEERLD